MEAYFTDELILNTYLYAKRRLGDGQDAEELAQEILCQALAGLRAAERSGRSIAAFHPWYWRLAGNQTNIFLRLKYNGAVSLDEVSEFLPSECDPAEELISAEEKSELNLALSRLSRIHREILICHYLRGLTEAETARLLEIPEGTVKRRLYDAKQKLREDMIPRENTKGRQTSMEATGRSAFAPAKLNLQGSNNAPAYWNNVNDLMTKQIFVICRQKPRTVREISEEIGVAPVYFEDKLEYLLTNRFLKETSKGRYLTDFVILPQQNYADFQSELAGLYADAAAELRDAILSAEGDLRSFDYYGSDFPRGVLMWLWYYHASNILSRQMTDLYRESKPEVPKDNGKDYRYMGTFVLPDETIVYPERRAISWSNMHWNYRTAEYKQITYANLYEAEPFADRDHILNDQNIALFMRLAASPASPLTQVEETMAAELLAVGFLERREGGLYPALPIMSYKTKGRIEERLARAVEPLSRKYLPLVSALGERMLLPLIREDLYEEFVNWVMLLSFWPYSYVMWQAMRAPDEFLLELPEDYARSAASTEIYYIK